MALSKYAKTKHNPKALSGRYRGIALVVENDYVRLSMPRYNDKLTDYKTGEVPLERIHRPDLIAYVLYNQPALFWALYHYNRELCQGPLRFTHQSIIKLPRVKDLRRTSQK